MNEKEYSQKIKKEIKIVDALLIIIILLFSILLTVNYKEIGDFALANLEGYGLIAIFILIFIFEFFPQIMSPDYVILLAIPLELNIYGIVLSAMVASAAGSYLGYYLGYHHGFHLVRETIKEKSLNKILYGWKKHGKWFVLASAVVPLPIPYFPLVFGALRMNKKEFLLWGLIPRILGFILTGIIGYYGVIQIGKWF